LLAPEIWLAAILFALIGPGSRAGAQSGPEAERLADAVLQSGSPANGAWNEETGLQLEGLEATWYNTAKGDYFRSARGRVDAVLETTTNPAMSPFEGGLLGRQYLLLYRVTLAPKYYNAAAAIRAQLAAVCDLPRDSGAEILQRGSGNPGAACRGLRRRWSPRQGLHF
jgi:hypothetical protein